MMKDLIEKLTLLESNKPAEDKESFSAMKEASKFKFAGSYKTGKAGQWTNKGSKANRPAERGDLVGSNEAVEHTVEELVAKLGTEFKSQFLGNKEEKHKDRDIANRPKDKEITAKKKPDDGIRVKEGVEMTPDSASPVGSVPQDTGAVVPGTTATDPITPEPAPPGNVVQKDHVNEDWGSSDTGAAMRSMWRVIDDHFGGRANPESIQDAAMSTAEFYYEDMGYDSVHDAAESLIGSFLRRPDGIGRKKHEEKHELEEVAPPAQLGADAGMQGQLNVKQLASILPGINPQQLAMAITVMKAGQEPSITQQKALAGAFAALIKADPQTTTKAMAILKKVSEKPAQQPAVGTKPAGALPVQQQAPGTQPTATPAAGGATGTPATAGAGAAGGGTGAATAKESADYIKENKKRK